MGLVQLVTQNLELALNVTYNPPHSASPQEDIYIQQKQTQLC